MRRALQIFLLLAFGARAMAGDTTVTYTTASGGSIWSIPANLDTSKDVVIEVTGAGETAGAGGAYSRSIVKVSMSKTYTLYVDSPAFLNTYSGIHNDTDNAWLVKAESGGGTTPGTGGSTSNGVGDIKRGGGDAGAGAGAGGGEAGAATGSGHNGSVDGGSGGAGGTGGDGADGGAGGNGHASGSAGVAPGGGGGKNGGAGGTPGPGARGEVKVEYFVLPPAGPPTIKTNGFVTASPTKPYTQERWATNDLPAIRTSCTTLGIMPAINGGEDPKAWKLRQAKAAMTWITTNMNWTGFDSDAALTGNCKNILSSFAAGTSPSVIASGAFTTCDSLTLARIFELAGTHYNQMSMAGDGTYTGFRRGIQDGTVNCMCVYNGKLYVGGTFTQAGNTGGIFTANNIACYDGLNWTALSGTPGVTGTVNAMAVFGGKLYVGGTLSAAGAVSVAKLASWDGTTWAAVGTNNINNNVNGLFSFGGKLWIGGSFTVPATRITTWDGANFANGYGSAGPNSAVYCFATYNGVLYCGGQFVTCDGGSGKNKVMRWDGSSWQITDAGGIQSNVSTTNVVKALAQIPGGNLIAAGNFSHTNGFVATCTRVAQWNGTGWSDLGTPPGADADSVLALLPRADGMLYIGKDNGSSSGSPKYFYKWNGSAWSVVGDGSTLDGAVNALCEYPAHWVCQTINKVLVGICQAHGIPARIISSPDPVGNGDTETEVYSYVDSKWFLVLGLYNAYVETAAGVPLSAQELKYYNDNGGVSVTVSGGVYSFAAAGGSGLVPKPNATCQCTAQPQLSDPWWCGLTAGDSSGNNPADRRYHQFLYHVTGDYVNEFNGGASESGINTWDSGDPYGTQWILGNDKNFSYPLNQVQCTSAAYSGTDVVIALTESMSDTAHGFDLDHLEKSVNAGSSWNTITLSGGNYTWTPGADTSILIRGVSTSGAVSPTVRVDVQTSLRRHYPPYGTPFSWRGWRF